MIISIFELYNNTIINMSKLLVSLLLAVFATSYMSAQSIQTSHNIDWKPNKEIQTDSINSFEILNFQGASRNSSHFLPVFYERIPLEHKPEKLEFKFSHKRFSKVPDKQLKHVNHLDEIGTSINAEIFITTERHRHYASFACIPLRKNPENGDIERLESFTASIDYSGKLKNTITRDYSATSKLNSGTWYKFKVSESGIYELSYEQIQELGFDDPANTGIFGYGGMLAKKNSDPRYDDLPQRHTYHKDANNNGIFDAGDKLIMYLEGPDRHYYNSPYSAFTHRIHSYSDYSYYFISDQGSLNEIPVESSEDTPNQFTKHSDAYATITKDSVNIMGSGRTLFWRHFSYYTEYSFQKNFHHVDPASPAKILIHLAARSSAASSFDISLNGSLLGSAPIGSVSGNYAAPYAEDITQVFTVNSPGNTFNFDLEYNQTASNSEGWLDYITINLRTYLHMNDNTLFFRDMEIVGTDNITEYAIAEAAGHLIWDISDPVNLFQITASTVSNDSLYFSAASDSLREFVAVNPLGSFPSPSLSGSGTGLIPHQNLHGSSIPDMIIVSHPDFTPYAQDLAAFHGSYDGLSTLVVEPQTIYNEFSSGAPDVSAIRDFVKMYYDKAGSAETAPKYLLLFGDGSYDNRNTESPNTAYILTYQSTESLKPTSSYTSDDFYVLLDDNEGSLASSESLDMGIGRLPVKSQAEAQDVLNKIFSYVSPDSFGDWRNLTTVIGDDGEDSNNHQTQANALGNNMMTNYSVYNVDKIFLDAFEQVSTVQGNRYPEVNQTINERVEQGALIMNYSGHGNEHTLAHENVVTMSQINTWENPYKLPVFVTATCEFSRFDNYNTTTAGEQILLQPNGGGIALFTTTRLVFSNANYSLNTAFYNHIFETDASHTPYGLGEVIMKTKNDLLDDSNKRNFSLLGDPALKLAIPRHQVVTDSINGENISLFSDTLNATSLVRITGHVEDHSGNVLSDFNGTLKPTVFDKKMLYETLGNDNNATMEYLEQMNVLYKGNSSIENGYFEFEFVVPVDIAYFYDYGKLSYYAYTDNTDAHGYYDVMIGGSADDGITDNQGPEIDLFMNNDNFTFGGITDENPKLLAYVSDETGINTVGNGIGHDIIAVLDGNTTDAINLNQYYEADINSYQSGTVTYPFSDLETGPHSLRVKVWDVFNNSAEDYTEFIVANSSELVIEDLVNFPNPFSDYTCFQFSHNHPDEWLSVEIKVYDLRGALMAELKEDIYPGGYTTDPLCWDGTNNGNSKLPDGIYVYHVKVTAQNGDVVNKFKKLMILK